MMKAAMWSVTIGVLSLVAAATLARLMKPAEWIFLLLLTLSVALIGALAALVVDLSPRTGAAGGAVAAALFAAVLALTIAAAPLAPGAERPGLRDLLWAPLFALVGMVAACAVAGFFGVRAGLSLARRRKA
jgi:hypothetical protein